MFPQQRIQNGARRNRVLIPMLIVLVAVFFPSACSSQAPIPGVYLPTDLAPTTVMAIQATNTPPSSFVPLTNTPTSILLIDTSTFTPTATLAPPTPSCGAPSSWVVYIIQSGDTLFSLSLKTNTTIDAIRSANCLTSDIIFVGNQLYLPFIPPVDTPVPPSRIPTSPCPSTLSCTSTALPPLVLAPGGGNDSTFTPCAPTDSNRIQVSSLIIELGERLYFFACNFPSPPISAAVILNNGSIQPVALLDPLTVHRDLITSTIVHTTTTGDVEYKAQAVIEWAAVPTDGSTQPTGIHTLIITYGSGNKEERKFMVNPPTKKHILVVPHADAPGNTFQVYYVNFDLNTSPTFELYGETQPSNVRGQHTLTYRGQWTVPITKSLPGSSDKGWAQFPLASASTDLRVTYSISYNQKEIYTLFWLE